MIYLAVDPGDRWTGLALMYLKDDTTIETEAVVLDTIERPSSIHDAASFIQEFPYKRDKLRVVVEDYRTRPLGHQSFGSGNTLRMIGAIEFAAYSQGHKITRVPPRDPKDGLLQLQWEWFDQWRKTWPDAGCRHWKHARSAWVALGFALIGQDAQLARLLPSVSQIETKDQPFPFLDMKDEILRAPTATFDRP